MLKDLRDVAKSFSDVVSVTSLEEVKIPSQLRNDLQDGVLPGDLSVQPFSSYARTSTTNTNYAIFPNQMYKFSALIYDFAFEVKKYFDCINKYKNNKEILKLCSTDSSFIKGKLIDSAVFNDDFDDEDYELFSKFIQLGESKHKKNDEFRLGGKSIFNFNPKTEKASIRTNEDCFGSIILTQINLPNSSSSIFGDLVYGLTENDDLFSKVKSYFDSVSEINTGLESSNLLLSRLPKSFLLLAGISGTGKTRFVRKQAEHCGDLNETYCLTSVRPDWHEPSDLLGYVSRLSGKAEYVVTDVLKFIVKAWIEIEKSGVTFNGKLSTGNQNQQQQVKPFWLCLDEMNLAPVEQYFADYLSILETREWLWDSDEFVYKCDPLLKPSLFEGKSIEQDEQDKLKQELGLTEHDDLWQHFVNNGIGIPFNLIVAGTVNMDETTHGFSRKVIDRALTFDFGQFFPNNFDEFFEPKNEPKVLSYPVWSDGRNKTELATTFDSDGSLSIALLESINSVLHNTPFKLAYRALNELLLSVMTNKPTTDIELQAVWDDFLMCKVLPRIEGDIDKLTKGGQDKNIIEQLEAVLSVQFKTIWHGEIRPDLYRKSLESETVINIECRSKEKLKWMSLQLDNGFTSFWP